MCLYGLCTPSQCVFLVNMVVGDTGIGRHDSPQAPKIPGSKSVLDSSPPLPPLLFATLHFKRACMHANVCSLVQTNVYVYIYICTYIYIYV